MTRSTTTNVRNARITDLRNAVRSGLDGRYSQGCFQPRLQLPGGPKEIDLRGSELGIRVDEVEILLPLLDKGALFVLGRDGLAIRIACGQLRANDVQLVLREFTVETDDLSAGGHFGHAACRAIATFEKLIPCQIRLMQSMLCIGHGLT